MAGLAVRQVVGLLC